MYVHTYTIHTQSMENNLSITLQKKKYQSTETEAEDEQGGRKTNGGKTE